MHSASSSTDHFNFPPMSWIRRDAAFLEKSLSVSHRESLEMIANRYDCNTWNDLTELAVYSRIPKVGGRHIDVVDHLLARSYRSKLQASYQMDSSVENLKDKKLYKNTVFHAIAKGRFDWLRDDEVAQLYRYIYEDSKEPLRRYSDALRWIGNDVSHLVEGAHVMERGSMYDYRYGFYTYFYCLSQGDYIEFTIVELDTLISPPVESLMEGGCFHHSSWFVKHVIGYINFLISCLQQRFPHGKIVFAKVNNELVADHYLERVPPLGNMDKLISELKTRGATVERWPCRGKRIDRRLGVALSF